MNGVKMSDCKFYINEAERTVVCVIPKTRDMVINFIGDHFKFREFDVPFAIEWNFEDKLLMPRSFSGKAVCAPEDEWSEETGKLIAFAKAKDKCYKSFFKRANALVQMIDGHLGDMITEFNNFGLKLENKREALQAQIDERTSTTEE